jgi:hypothetical protein
VIPLGDPAAMNADEAPGHLSGDARTQVVAAHRHSILYDRERWRRVRLPLLTLATISLVVAFLAPLVNRHGDAGLVLSLPGALLYGIAFDLWLRQRSGYLAVEGGDLVVHRMRSKRSIPLSEVHRAKVARVGATVNNKERRATLPRPRSRWLETDALTVRLDTDSDGLERLAQVLGQHFLFGRVLVVPVLDPEGLLREIEENTPQGAPPAPPRRRRRP